MYPLVACLIVLVAITLDRALALFRLRTRSAALIDEIGWAIRRGDVAVAMSLASAADEPTARIARAALLHWKDDREVLESAIEAQLDREIGPLAHRMRAFTALAAIATLIGLLGAVTGMVPGSSHGAADAASRATMLARAISESLGCTALGLFVSLYALAAGAVIHGVAHRITDELSLTAQEIRNLMFEHRAELRWRALAAPHERPTYRH